MIVCFPFTLHFCWLIVELERSDCAHVIAPYGQTYLGEKLENEIVCPLRKGDEGERAVWFAFYQS